MKRQLTKQKMQKVHEKHNKKATRKKKQKTSNPLKSLEWLT